MLLPVADVHYYIIYYQMSLNSYINTYDRWLYAAGNFLPYEIRQIFPCWDKPSIKVIIRSIFIRRHGNYTVLTGLPVLTGKSDLSIPSVKTDCR